MNIHLCRSLAGLFTLMLATTARAADPHCALPDWTYEAQQKWGEKAKEGLAKSACQSGKTQSPIALNYSNPRAPDPPVKQGDIVVTCKAAPGKAEMFNVGFTTSVHLPTDTCVFTVGKGAAAKKFSAFELHFHTPSEHALPTLMGPPITYDLEVHVKAQSKDDPKKVVVFAVLFMVSAKGKDDPTLVPFVKAMTSLELCKSAPVTVPDLSPWMGLFQQQNYFSYTGSLTTPTGPDYTTPNPDCTEGIDFYVLATALKAQKAQQATLESLLKLTLNSKGVNAREIQTGDRIKDIKVILNYYPIK